MMGLEMMLSNMIGLKPDELKRSVETTMAAISQGVSDLAEIKVRLANIEMYLSEKESSNGRKRIANGSDSKHIGE